MILEDKAFMDYIKESNNTLGEKSIIHEHWTCLKLVLLFFFAGEWQIVGLAKIAAFCRDNSLHEHRQSEIRDQCLHFWKVPDEIRRAPKFVPPHVKANELLGKSSQVCLLRTSLIFFLLWQIFSIRFVLVFYEPRSCNTRTPELEGQ